MSKSDNVLIGLSIAMELLRFYMDNKEAENWTPEDVLREWVKTKSEFTDAADRWLRQNPQ